MIRHHRLLEQYLAETLGMPIDEVHAEADRLEHALSEELEARIDETLGFPTHDPHGDPIPDAELNVGVEPSGRCTHSTRASARPSAACPTTRQLLGYLRGLGLLPGAAVELVRLAPFAGPVTVATAVLSKRSRSSSPTRSASRDSLDRVSHGPPLAPILGTWPV